MIHNIKNKLVHLSAYAILFTGIFTSCSNEVNLPGVDNSGTDKAQNTYAALKNANDPRPMRLVELYTAGGQVQVQLQLSKAMSADYTATLSFDKSALDAYNTTNSTSFTELPETNATLGSTTVTIPAGKTVSDPVTIALTGTGLTVGTSYVLPISFTGNNKEVQTSAGVGSYLFMVKYIGNTPNATKASGIKTIMIYEINDNNPLNAGEYTLTGTPNGVDDGKPLADVVVLFAANINYNVQTGKVYCSMNPQVTAILNNRDKYIKPLQDKGIKVVLGILGNHDVSGVADLAIPTAKAFAQQLKTVCDAYKLDGTFFDDEYSNYVYSNPPTGFVTPSSSAYAQLLYQVKAIMPDKLVTLYNYGNVYGMPASITDENGVSHSASSYIDYACEPMYYSFDNTMAGNLHLPNANVSPYSRKCDNGLSLAGYDYFYTYTIASLQQLRSQGYGAFTLYNLRLNNDYGTANNYVPAFNDIAKYLYDGQISFTGVTYPRDY